MQRVILVVSAGGCDRPFFSPHSQVQKGNASMAKHKKAERKREIERRRRRREKRAKLRAKGLLPPASEGR
ncbi:MAG TPA: hypothetical protein DCE18_17820 [Syntrophobacteraceae bacterium]|nr:hypothetical protein [Syntrophobacteraceae bacterium]HBZ55340.1 hypothetical protein [Syntrophobacteraceae bacterium]